MYILLYFQRWFCIIMKKSTNPILDLLKKSLNAKLLSEKTGKLKIQLSYFVRTKLLKINVGNFPLVKIITVVVFKKSVNPILDSVLTRIKKTELEKITFQMIPIFSIKSFTGTELAIQASY